MPLIQPARVLLGSSGVPSLTGSGWQSFTRPNNTTAYTAGDVVSDAAGTFTPILAFPLVTREGGGGYLVKAQLRTNSKTFLSSMRLYLFNTQAVVVAGDNVAGTQLYANLPYSVGYLDFSPLATGVGSGSTAANALWTGNVEFKCAAEDTRLYGYLVDNTGSTPVAFQEFAVNIAADVYG